MFPLFPRSRRERTFLGVSLAGAYFPASEHGLSLVVVSVVIARSRHIGGLFGIFKSTADAEADVGFGGAELLRTWARYVQLSFVHVGTAHACGEGGAFCDK